MRYLVWHAHIVFMLQNQHQFHTNQVWRIVFVVGVSIIIGKARSTILASVVIGWLSKPSPKQLILYFMPYTKHGHVHSHDSWHWKWSSSSICDVALVLANCINEGLQGKMVWPNKGEKCQLSLFDPHCWGYVGLMDGTTWNIGWNPSIVKESISLA